MKQDLNQHLFWKPELIVQRLRFTILSNKIIYVPQELNWYKIKTKSIYGIRITSLCSFLLISIKNLPNISTCKPFSTKISHKIYNTATTKSIYVEMRKSNILTLPKERKPIKFTLLLYIPQNMSASHLRKTILSIQKHKKLLIHFRFILSRNRKFHKSDSNSCKLC